jgi:large repetitive protein
MAVSSLTVFAGQKDTIGYSGALTFCEGGSIKLTATNADAASVCQWIKDGTNINGATKFEYTATTSGKYTVIVTKPNNLGPYDTVTVTVNAKPKITLTSATGTDNQLVCFSAALTNITYSITGATSNSINGLPPGVTSNFSGGVLTISGTPTTTGSFSFEITASDKCTQKQTGIIDIKPLPVAGFNFATSGLCSNTPINFTSTSTGDNLSYKWNFGDNNATSNSASTANPTHEFIGTNGNGTQNFSVSLTVTTSFGCADSVQRTINTKQIPSTKLGGPSPTSYNGLLYFRQCTGAATATLNFTNQSTTVASNTSYTIKWGDNSPDFSSPGFNAPLTHTYNSGTYPLQFIVSGNNGCTDTTTYYVFVGSNPAVGLGIPENTLICTGTSLTFPISVPASNSPEVVYKIVINDGTDSVIYSHPPPTSITHEFNASSCGTNSTSFNNSFFVRMQASNACLTSESVVSPIYVSEKPKATFAISPNDTTCVNTVTTITNTSGAINYVNNNECASGSFIWSISPATGWTLANGTIIGNDFGLEDPSLWQNGTNFLSVIFTQTGTYTIKLKTGNPNCGMDSLVKTICVNPTPVASFLLDKTEGCLPLTVRTTNTSNSPICGDNTYEWSVTYSNTNGCSPAVAKYSFVEVTDLHSVNPVFLFENPGVYTISLVAKSSGGNCVSQVFSKQVTVKAKPNVSLVNIPASICQGGSVNPLANVNNCYSAVTPTYSWTFNGGIPATSTSSNPGIVIFNSAGTYTITLVVENECGKTEVSQDIIIKPSPDAIVPDNQSFCVGASAGPFTFSSSFPGTSFSWTNNNTLIGLAASGSGNIFAFTTTNGGTTPATGNISVIPVLNGCTGPSATFNITVNPKPLAPGVVSPLNYCQGDGTVTALTATTASGNTLLWYTSATGGTGSPTAPTPVTTITGNTKYYVSQINTASGCEGPRALIEVNVYAVPVIDGTAASPATCGSTSGNITLTGLNASTSYQISYTRNSSPVNTSATSDPDGKIIIGNLGAGVYDAIFVTLNGCSSNKLGPFSLSDPTPPTTPFAGSNSPVCSGGTLTLNASTSTLGAITYNWTGPEGYISTSQNPTRNNTLTNMAGSYSVTATVNGCTSAPATTVVVINETPATPVLSSNTPICSGNDIQLNVSNIYTGLVTYAWTGPASFNSTEKNPLISKATSSNSGTYSLNVTAAIGNCVSAAGSTNVLVNETPVIDNAKATNPNSCGSATGSIELSGLAVGLTFTVHYTFNGAPLSASLVSNSEGKISISNLKSGVYDGIYVVLNSCSSNIMGPYALVDPNPPPLPVISNNGPLCSGADLQLNASDTPPGATYSWSGPDGFISTAANPVYNNVPVTAAGTYFLQVILNGCTSASAATTVVVNATPAMPVISSNAPVCSTNTLTLLANTSFSGALSYSWTGPNGFTSDIQNPTIPNVTVGASGTYFLTATATSGSCPSLAGTALITINPTPVIAGSSFTNPVNCSTASGKILLNGLSSNATYQVYFTANGVPQSNSITTDNNGILTINNIGAGIYSNIYVQQAGCTSNIVGPITLSDPNPPATPLAASNSAICAGVTLNLTAVSSTTGNIIYAWTGPDNFVSNIQNPVIPNATANNNGTYYVSATLNNCTSLQDSVQVVINPLAATPIVISPVNYCNNTTASLLTAEVLPGNTLSWYTTANGGVGSSSAPLPTTNSVGTTNYYVSQSTGFGCEGARAEIAVIVHPDATAAFNFIQDSSCAAFFISSSNIQPVIFNDRNSDYLWYANDAGIGSGTNFPGFTITNGGDAVTIKMVAISKYGCLADSISHQFFTPETPVTAFTADQSTGCGPLTINFNNTTPFASSFNYLWNFGNGNTSTLINPGSISFASSPFFVDTTYTVTLAGYTDCDTVLDTRYITVKSKPKSLFTPVQSKGCSPFTAVFNNTSLGNNKTFIWNFGDGNSLITNSDSLVHHTYYTNIQDTFYAKLITINECGSDTTQYAIVVSPNAIKLDFAVNGNETTGCNPHTVRFINNTSGATSFRWDFGDGNVLSTNKNIDTITHLYQKAGIYQVLLIASNGCSDTSTTETIQVFNKPIVAFSSLPAQVCLGDTIQFNNLSDTVTSVLWKFDDGNTSSLLNPIHNYTKAGIYNVTLTGIRQYGIGNSCTDSVSQQVTVVSSLPGAFSLSDSIGNCVPFAVTFSNLSIPSVNTTWDFGNGAKDTGDVVIYNFTETGLYNIQMNAISSGGCRYTANKTINIRGPKGTWKYDHDFICNNTPVRFEATVQDTDSLRWHFGDGSTLVTKENIVYHTYLRSGAYLPSVELLLGNTGTCAVLLNGADTIKADNISAGYTINSQMECGFTTVQFTDTSRVFYGATAWQWKFGDGITSNQQNPQHNYTNTNTWPVQLIITSASGCSDTVNRSQNIAVKTKPVANIIANATACTTLPVTYTANVTSKDSVNLYSWQFSNGLALEGKTINPSFGATGDYTATLITGTVNGCYDTTSKTITINQSPVVTASNDALICRGQQIQLTTSGAATYQWSPLNNNLSCTTCANPIASPITSVMYIVAGTNSVGCIALDSVYITVAQPIQISISGNDSICIGQSTRLFASGAANYTWSPNTGVDDINSPSPLFSPIITTAYMVIGADKDKCFSDTAYITLGIGKYPTIDLGADKTLATGTILPLTSTVTEGPISNWAWKPQQDLSCSNCALPLATVRKDICYNVTATNAYGCSATDTICIKVFCESGQLFIPNAFTPDGDGRNDILMVRGKGIKTVKSFRVFNRWGQVVFERNNFPPNDKTFGWNGLINGKPASPDVYVYTCEVVCENDVPYTYKGNVAILK